MLGSGASIDVNQSNIDHNQLLNYYPKQHFYQKNIDTVKSITGLIKASSGVLAQAVSGTDYEPAITSKGNLSATSNKISITGSNTNALLGSGASIDVNQSNIDHNQLLNYYPKQHFYQKNIDTVKSITGLLKANSGVLAQAVAGNDYQLPMGYTPPINISNNNISISEASTTQPGYLSSSNFTLFSKTLNTMAGPNWTLVSSNGSIAITANSPSTNNLKIETVFGGNGSATTAAKSDHTHSNYALNTISINAGSGLTGGGALSSSQTISHSSNSWNPPTLSVASVISDFTTDGLGHFTNWTTRNLTPADISALALSGGALTGAVTSSSTFAASASVADGVVKGTNTSTTAGMTVAGGIFTGTYYGVVGKATSTSLAQKAGGYFTCGGGGETFVASYFNTGSGLTLHRVCGNGVCKTETGGAKGLHAALYSNESPEILVSDYGTGQLVNGFCHISFDPVFSQLIFVDDNYPIKVFIQLEGDCKGVYVANKTENGFDVFELQGGTSNVKFSYSVVANRADETDQSGAIISKHVGVRFH